MRLATTRKGGDRIKRARVRRDARRTTEGGVGGRENGVDAAGMRETSYYVLLPIAPSLSTTLLRFSVSIFVLLISLSLSHIYPRVLLDTYPLG